MSAFGGIADIAAKLITRDEARRIAAARQQNFWKRARQRGTLTGGST